MTDTLVERQIERLKEVETALANGAYFADEARCHPLYPHAVAARQILDTTLKAQASRIAEKDEALREIENLPGEINPSNYDHDDVCELNRQFCYAVTIARKALSHSSETDDD
jgi:hypothetical protein